MTNKNEVDLALTYVTFEELNDMMRQKKWETKYQMVPYGKKGKATFAGYGVSCWGVWSRSYWIPSEHTEKCDFKIHDQKRVTKKMHKDIMNHLFEHPNHEIHCHAGFDIPA